ncbi:hypothetical protein D3C87_1351490 [compost metagenome]
MQIKHWHLLEYVAQVLLRTIQYFYGNEPFLWREILSRIQGSVWFVPSLSVPHLSVDHKESRHESRVQDRNQLQEAH